MEQYLELGTVFIWGYLNLHRNKVWNYLISSIIIFPSLAEANACIWWVFFYTSSASKCPYFLVTLQQSFGNQILEIYNIYNIEI